MDRTRVLIMGAAGRDFHDFNVVYRDDPDDEVVAFTATQIPGIDRPPLSARTGRPALPGRHPDRPGAELEQISPASSRSRRLRLQRRRPRVRDARAPRARRRRRFRAARAARDDDPQHEARRRDRRHAHRCRQEPDDAVPCRCCSRPRGSRVVVIRHPMPYGDLVAAARPALRDLCRPRPPRDDDRGARGVRAASRRGTRPIRRRRLRGDPAPGREGGRRHPLGRRQQRLPVLQAGPLRGRGGSAAARARDALSPRASPTCGWPTSSSSTRSTRPSRARSSSPGDIASSTRARRSSARSS